MLLNTLQPHISFKLTRVNSVLYKNANWYISFDRREPWSTDRLTLPATFWAYEIYLQPLSCVTSVWGKGLWEYRVLSTIMSGLLSEESADRGWRQRLQRLAGNFFLKQPKRQQNRRQWVRTCFYPLPCQPRLFSGHVCKFLLHNILLIRVTSRETQIWFPLWVLPYTPLRSTMLISGLAYCRHVAKILDTSYQQRWILGMAGMKIAGLGSKGSNPSCYTYSLKVF